MVGRRSTKRPAVRQANIVELVARHGEMSVDDLATRFNTSQETIRRDLSLLAEAGQIRKVHGGARSLWLQDEDPFNDRMRRNLLSKRIIAEKVVHLVSPGDVLFLDTGSTTLICAEALARVKDLTVVTNSTRIASTFASGVGAADTFLLGGRYHGDNAQTIGLTAVDDVGGYRADHAIITIGALDPTGAMDFSKEEAQVARAMVKAASRVIIVADRSKFDRRAAFLVCSLDQIDRLVSDVPPQGQLADAIASAGVEVT